PSVPLLRRLPALASAHDELRRRLLLVPSLLPFDLPPGIGGWPAAGRLALTAAERVVHGIHRDAPHAGHPPEPAALAGLAHRQELMLCVRHLADGGEAFAAHHTHFRGAEPQRDVV